MESAESSTISPQDDPNEGLGDDLHCNRRLWKLGYYADSTMYDDLSIRVFEFDEDVLIWDEDTYYRME